MCPGICSSLLGCSSMGIAGMAIGAGWAHCHPDPQLQQYHSIQGLSEVPMAFYSDTVDLL